MAGFVFALTLGPFGLFHLYLVLKNRTTLENMEPSSLNIKVPQDKLSKDPLKPASMTQRSSLEVPRQQVNGEWRADHMLSRDERRRAKRITEATNPYDLGWKQNFTQTFDPDHRGFSWRWFLPQCNTGS